MQRLVNVDRSKRMMVLGEPEGGGRRSGLISSCLPEVASALKEASYPVSLQFIVRTEHMSTKF